MKYIHAQTEMLMHISSINPLTYNTQRYTKNNNLGRFLCKCAVIFYSGFTKNNVDLMFRIMYEKIGLITAVLKHSFHKKLCYISKTCCKKHTYIDLVRYLTGIS